MAHGFGILNLTNNQIVLASLGVNARQQMIRRLAEMYTNCVKQGRDTQYKIVAVRFGRHGVEVSQ